MERHIPIAFAFAAGLVDCAPVLQAPAAGTPAVAASASVSAAIGPYAARPLEGPFASLDAYCKAAAKKYEWGPDRHCRLDDASPVSAPSASAGARILRIDDRIAGGPHAATCHLAIVTPDGTFVDGPDEPNQICEGILGPTSHIDTRFEELAWTGGHLRLRAREMRGDGEWVEHDAGPMTLAYGGTTTDWLVLCSIGATGIPRCTPRIPVGCSDAQSTTGAHQLQWSLSGAVLRLRSVETASLECDLGEPLVVGDHVVW